MLALIKCRKCDAIFPVFFSVSSVQLSCLPPPRNSSTTAASSPVPAPGPPSISPQGVASCWDNPKYYSFIAVLALIATTMLVQVSHMVKLTLMLLITVATGVVNVYSWSDIFDQYDEARFKGYRLVLM